MASILSSPASDFAAITTSDTVGFPQCRGIYVGVTGNVVAVTSAGVAVTFIGAVAGSVIPVQAVRVNATSTTASSLVALY